VRPHAAQKCNSETSQTVLRRTCRDVKSCETIARPLTLRVASRRSGHHAMSLWRRCFLSLPARRNEFGGLGPRTRRQVCQEFRPSGSRHQVSRQYHLRRGLRYPEGVTGRRRAAEAALRLTLIHISGASRHTAVGAEVSRYSILLDDLVAVEDKLLRLAIGMDGKRLRLLDARIAGHVRGRHRPHKSTAATGQIEQQPTDHCHQRRPGKVAVRARPEWRFCGTRTFDRRHGSRRDREARCSGGVLKSLAEGG
jgi:hypothetical protein